MRPTRPRPRGRRGPALPLAASLLALWGATSASADGMFAPRVGTGVAATADQQALLVLGKEETVLALRTGYQGDGGAFAWVIPCPQRLTREQVTTASAGLFEALDSFTAPQLVEYELNCGTAFGCAGEGAGTDAGETQAAVRVFDRFWVDAYELSVVEADSGASMVDWLSSRSHEPPPGAADVFGSYVERGWSFVAVEFSPAAQPSPPESEGQGSDDAPSAATNEARALVIRLAGQQPSFPLLVSSLSTRSRVDLLLHTVAAGRYRAAGADFVTFEMTLPSTYEGWDWDGYYDGELEARLAEHGRRSLAVEYAGPLPDRLLDTLQREGVFLGLSLGTERPFVTRLRGRLDPADMDRDLELEPVPGEAAQALHRVRVVTGHGSDAGLAAAAVPVDVLAVLGLAGLLRSLRRRRRTS